jgi:hypothetical protein
LDSVKHERFQYLAADLMLERERARVIQRAATVMGGIDKSETPEALKIRIEARNFLKRPRS